jgi:hypothetical protein
LIRSINAPQSFLPSPQFLSHDDSVVLSFFVRAPVVIKEHASDRS